MPMDQSNSVSRMKSLDKWRMFFMERYFILNIALCTCQSQTLDLFLLKGWWCLEVWELMSVFCKHLILPHVHPSNLWWSPVPSPKLGVPPSERDSCMAAAVLVLCPSSFANRRLWPRGFSYVLDTRASVSLSVLLMYRGEAGFCGSDWISDSATGHK